MNEEDLEQELAALRPAAAAHDLMRKLRAAPPQVRMWRFWRVLFATAPQPVLVFVACAALLLASVSLALAWRKLVPHPPTPGVSRPAVMAKIRLYPVADPTIDSSTTGLSGVTDTKHDFSTPANLQGAFAAFSRLRVGLALLGSGADLSSKGDFDLETTGGQFCLKPDAALFGNGLRESPFGKFNLNGND